MFGTMKPGFRSLATLLYLYSSDCRWQTLNGKEEQQQL